MQSSGVGRGSTASTAIGGLGVSLLPDLRVVVTFGDKPRQGWFRYLYDDAPHGAAGDLPTACDEVARERCLHRAFPGPGTARRAKDWRHWL